MKGMHKIVAFALAFLLAFPAGSVASFAAEEGTTDAGLPPYSSPTVGASNQSDVMDAPNNTGALYSAAPAAANALYNAGDIAVINNMIENNGLPLTKDDPAGWGVEQPWPSSKIVHWTNIDGEMRITQLDFANWPYSRYRELHGVLDVSNLPYLKTLDCSLTKVAGLNLTGLTNLTSLYCRSNNVSELDLSGLINLETLDCEHNEVRTFDFSGLTKLKDLTCGGGDVKEVDLSGLVNLERLHCPNTLSKIDLSGLTNLRSLSCANAREITVLDLSPVPNLEILTCNNTSISELDLSVVPKMKWLDVRGTNITELDVSGLSQLERLSCDGSKIFALDLSANTRLTKLGCRGASNLSNLDLSMLSSLGYLDCWNNTFDFLILPNNVKLTVNQTVGGKVVLSGLPYEVVKPGVAEKEYGRLVAVPDEGYKFDRWVTTPAGSTEDGANLKFYLTENCTAEARFKKIVPGDIDPVEPDVIGPVQPIIHGGFVKWKYRKKLLGFLFDDRSVPPFPASPSGSNNAAYQKEFKYWAEELGYDVSDCDLEEILDTPVRMPFLTNHKELVFDTYSNKTVKDVMADILMLGKMQEYLFETEEAVKAASDKQHAMEQLIASTKDMLNYLSRYREYLGQYKEFKFDPITAIKIAVALEPVCDEILVVTEEDKNTEEDKDTSVLVRVFPEHAGILKKFKSLAIDLKPEIKNLANSISSTSNTSKYSEFYTVLQQAVSTGVDIYQGNGKELTFKIITSYVDAYLDNSARTNQFVRNYRDYIRPLSGVYDFVKAVDKGTNFSIVLSMGKIFVKYIEFAGSLMSYITDQYPSWLFWMNYYTAREYPDKYSQVGFNNNGVIDALIPNVVNSSGTDALAKFLLETSSGNLWLVGWQDEMEQEDREILINSAVMLSEISQYNFHYAQRALIKYALAAQDGGEKVVQATVSCPVDVELLNEEGTVLFTLKNGDEYEKNYNEYCSFYLTGENLDEKTIIYPESYSLRIIPYEAGTMECAILEESSSNMLQEKVYTAQPLTVGLSYSVQKQEENGETELIIQSQNVTADAVTYIPTQLDVQAGTEKMEIGTIQQLTVTLNQAESSPESVSWSSSDVGCISVDENGTLYAIQEGTATITAIYSGTIPLEDSIFITVLPQNSTQHHISWKVAGYGDIGHDLLDTYIAGEKIEVEAFPGENSSFACWQTSDGEVLEGNPIALTMPEHSLEVTAIFQPNPLPETPVSCTSNSITLAPHQDGGVSSYGEIQYGYGKSAELVTNWQANTTFENLTPGTDYTFFVRYAGNEFVLPSMASNGTTIRTATGSSSSVGGDNTGDIDSGSNDGEESSSSFEDDEHIFWQGVRWQILQAESGSTIRVDAQNYDRMSWAVMDALRENSGVALEVHWNGGKNIKIPAGQALNEANRIYYPLSYLVGYGFGKTTTGSGNPATGGKVVSISAPVAAPSTTGNTLEVTHPQRGLAETPELAEQGVEQPLPGIFEPGNVTPSSMVPADAPARRSMNLWLVAIFVAVAAASVGGGLWFWKRRQNNQ